MAPQELSNAQKLDILKGARATFTLPNQAGLNPDLDRAVTDLATELGHEVIVYTPEGQPSEVEHIAILFAQDRSSLAFYVGYDHLVPKP